MKNHFTNLLIFLKHSFEAIILSTSQSSGDVQGQRMTCWDLLLKLIEKGERVAELWTLAVVLNKGLDYFFPFAIFVKYR